MPRKTPDYWQGWCYVCCGGGRWLGRALRGKAGYRHASMEAQAHMALYHHRTDVLVTDAPAAEATR